MFTQGFTLIELLLAMAAGSLILLSLTQVVQASKAVYRVHEGLARLQESGRLAMEFMARDLRMSGFSGCSSSQLNSIGNRLQGEEDSLMNNFRGYRLEGLDDYDGQVIRYADDRPFANRTARSRPVVGTDVLIVRRPVGQPLRLAEDGDHRAGELRVWLAPGEPPVEAGDLLLLSDCNHSRVFRASGSRHGGTDLPAVVDYVGDWASRGPVFQKGAAIYRLETRMYYVRRGTRGDGNSLYLKQGDDDSPPQELLEGVEDLQILYGVGERRARGLSLRRLLPASVVERQQLWDLVTSVQLRVGLASLERNLTLDAGSGDGRLRRDFTTLVTLRNRAL